MPLQATSGAASYDAFGGGVPVEPNYIESVFSTYLYDGNSSTNTIVNGIDLSGKGGLTWIKSRNTAVNNALFDTARGDFLLQSNNTQGQFSGPYITYNSNGFSLGNESQTNNTGRTYVSWTFRKQPKFFDVVTYTGNGVDDRQIAHSLGSTPGCVMIKRTDTTGDWAVSHNYDFGNVLFLNTTAAAIANPSSNGYFGYPANPLQPTYFTLGTNAATNASGGTYVAYIFASDSGGFGLTGTDNVISCGSTTANGSGDFSVTLGYEPQWVLLKSTGSGRWSLFDNMRGVTASSGYTSSKRLQPQASDAEDQFDAPYGLGVNATGFTGNLATFSNDFIYIAIRRGPMKVPTSGTSVLNITTSAGTSPAYVSSFPVDFAYRKQITSTSSNYFHTRLQGAKTLYTNSTAAEDDDSNVTWAYQNGMFTTTGANADQYGWLMRRAPSFMDVVCFTGDNSSSQTLNHNLGVTPELIIMKERSGTGYWAIYSSFTGTNKYMYLNTTMAATTETNVWTATQPTATQFFVNGPTFSINTGNTAVAYLFATCAGVSKVTSFTGNGSSQTINCGFTGGARLVLIKRTDSTGDWYIWDSARGIVSGNDPHLSLNSTAAEVTTDDTIDTDSTGFIVNQVSATNCNVNGANYIVLAVA